MLPNLIYPEAGKILFAFFDVIIAVLAACILSMWLPPPSSSDLHSSTSHTSSQHNCHLTTLSTRSCVLYSCLYLFSPLAVNISTRGSSDSVAVCLLYLLLYLLLTNRLYSAGIAYGLVVHLRIYPIIFAPALFLFLVYKHLSPISTQPSFPLLYKSLSIPSFSVLIKHCLDFFIPSLVTFSSLLYLFYSMCGETFLYETYTYHLSRVDVRHNFSPYFLQTYLLSASPSYPSCPFYLPSPPTSLPSVPLSDSPVHTYPPLFASFFSLLPTLLQCIIILVCSVTFATSPPLAFITITWAFVAFNKVITAQYFLWWTAFLPLLLPLLTHSTLPYLPSTTRSGAPASSSSTASSPSSLLSSPIPSSPSASPALHLRPRRLIPSSPARQRLRSSSNLPNSLTSSPLDLLSTTPKGRSKNTRSLQQVPMAVESSQLSPSTSPVLPSIPSTHFQRNGRIYACLGGAVLWQITEALWLVAAMHLEVQGEEVCFISLYLTSSYRLTTLV